MIKVESLNVDYFGNPALKDVNVEIQSGYTVGIIGPNGAGKSTFLKSMLDVVKKRTGVVTIDGVDIKSMKRRVAYVPQKSEVDLSFPITVRDTVLTGTYPGIPLFKRPNKRHHELVDACLKKLSLEDLAHKQIANLSGGQLQRVFIARALAQEADYFFLDEPFVGIDLVSESIIVSILKTLREAGKTIFVVHHDLHEVEAYFDKLLIVNRELVACGDVKDVFTTENIKKAYGTSLGNFEIRGLGDEQ